MNPGLYPPYAQFQGMNKFGSQAENGITVPNCPEYTDRPFDVVFDIPSFTSNVVTNQAIDFEPDADFIIHAIVINNPTGPAFGIRFYDSTGYYMSNDFLPSQILRGSLAVPWVVFPGKLIPAGGQLRYDMSSTGGFSADAQIVLRGCKRFRLRS